jgi:hypothetical protein
MVFRMTRTGLLMLVFAAVSAAQQLSVDKLVEFIRSSVAQKLPDKEVAAQLATFRLTGKLEDRVVEELQGMGAGPRTVAALTKLADQSVKLAVAAPPTPTTPKYVEPPAPPQADQEKILAQVREYALNYAKSLPNFICLQVTRRSVDSHFQSGTKGAWSPTDTIHEKLSYFDQQEKYEPIAVNGNAMFGKTWETLGGSISRGEFGSLLRDVFEPETDAIIVWDHWGTWDKKLAYVFRYVVLQPRSHYSVEYQKSQRIVPGYHGLVYVEKGPNVILRLTIEPDMPDGFPLQEIHQEIRYGYFSINGQDYLLPLTSSVQSRAGTYASRNEIEFRKYQKYSADTSIKFDDTDEPVPPAEGKPAGPPKP